MLLKDYDLHV